MGKNQAYKAMQRARLGSSSGAPGAADAPEDGMTDGSFHSPEWHAARLASLNKTHTLTWEEFKKKQKEEELKRGELEADKDKMMREYRAQLDAERAQKLANGRNHSRSNSKSSSSKKERKDKDAKKRSKKRRKHKSSSESSSSSSSESSSSDDEDRGSRKSRSRSRSKRTRKEKKSRSRSKRRGSESEEEGPVRLSKFFGK
ncbi:CBF1 interacting corepressor [Zea mays]|nr:CBF1 interacting corepressor [Zea mays]ACF85114.1 unknown [Zea mays]